VFTPFDWILVMCAAAGLLMVVGSIALLYKGAIQLSEMNTEHALEAEFKNQVKVNVRNPALGLFVIGFAFFGLALFFAKPESEPLVIRGHINIADIDGIVVRLKSDESLINVTSEGEIFTTVQPVEHLSVVIEAPPGYRPPKWSHQVNPDEVKHGRIEIHPDFRLASEVVLPSRSWTSNLTSATVDR